MNVFWHELRLNRKATVIWSIGLFLLMVISMAKFQAITAQGGAAIDELMRKFPSTIQAIFGMVGLDLATVGGYFGVCYLLLAVALAVHAGLTGMGILAEEESDHTTEFLYTKPRSRTAIITAKLVAGFVLLALVWAASTTGSVIGIEKFAQFSNFAADFWRMMLAAAMIQCVFFACGAAIAAITNRNNIQGMTVMITVFGSYLIYTFAKLSPKFDWIHYASMFSWFDAGDILHSHSLKPHYVIAALALTCIFLVVTYVSYRRRDLRT